MTPALRIVIALLALLATLATPAVSMARSTLPSIIAAVPLEARMSGAFAVSPIAAAEAEPASAPGAALEPLGSINPISVLDAAGSILAARQASGNTPSRPAGGLSPPINILILLTVISLAPSIMLMTTCFLRIIIVLGLLKQAVGTQQLPPPQVVVSLALFMTLLVMAPTFDRVHDEALVPYQQGRIADYDELWAKVRQPVRDFMFDQIDATGNWSAVYMVLNYRGVDTSRPERLTTADVDMISLVPAFMLSELKTGFMIGFKVYLPFLVIDMLISAILLSMGMMMLPPVLISLPFKLLLFVLVDGWQLIVGSLLQSFARPPPLTEAGPAGAASWLDPPLITNTLANVLAAVA